MPDITEAKEAIKNTPISSIIQNYLAINRKGQNYEAICPFHQDTKPSLKINDHKGIYKCFACGASGDAIKFVQEKLNLSFPEAVKEAGAKIGIHVEDQKKSDPKVDTSLRILKVANKIYQKTANEVATEEFNKFLAKRGLNKEIVEEFQIGFAPGNNAVLNYIQSIKSNEKNNILKIAKELGIVRVGQNNSQYDFFRQRITFPIWDHSGKVRGFSTRAIRDDQKPKYLNSGESFIFDKKNILYGFHLAKQAIRKKDAVIVVEGNMDAVALHQYGLTNSVATMGVALSENSAKLLSNMTKNIYLGMDSDDAGLVAMKRINNIFLKIGIHPKYINYEPAKDPDEFLQEFGRLELIKKIEEAPLFVDYLFDLKRNKSSLDTTDQKLEVLNSVFEIFCSAKNNLWAYEKITFMAEQIGINSSTDDILNAFKTYQKENQTPGAPPSAVSSALEKLASDQDDMELELPAAAELSPSTEMTKVEANLLTAFLNNPELLESTQITEILDLIPHFEVKRVVEWLKSIYLEIDESDYIYFLKQKLQEYLPAEIRQIFSKVVLNYKKEQKLSKKIIDKMICDFASKLKMEKLFKEKDLLKKQRSQCKSDQESFVFLEKIQKIESEIAELKK